MSSFAVNVHRITIESHPNADRLELAVIGGYRSVVRKGQFAQDELVGYIPCGAVLPQELITEMGLGGMLAGKTHNRVKEVRLRSILSEGLCISLTNRQVNGLPLIYEEGDDITDVLGIVKYQPPIPTEMAGEVTNVFGHTIRYDIENYKRFPDVIQEGEMVAMTEKLHGTFCCISYSPFLQNPDLEDGNVMVSSKGVFGSGLSFKFNDKNKNNVYLRAYQATRDSDGNSVLDRVKNLAKRGTLDYLDVSTPIYIMGEVFGHGIQDLQYGLVGTINFRGFDVYVGVAGKGRYLNFDEKMALFDLVDIPKVPVLYTGPFSHKLMVKHTNGLDTISKSHVREGLVINVLEERFDLAIGRVFLKSVSEKYLLRKNSTEYT